MYVDPFVQPNTVLRNVAIIPLSNLVVIHSPVAGGLLVRQVQQPVEQVVRVVRLVLKRR